MELQKEFGIEMYDFGARNYQPDLGRWFNIDPLAEIAHDKTPYHFVSNNPINRIDPDGLTDYEVNKKGEIINVIENKKADNIYIIDDDGNRLEGQSISFEYGTIEATRNPFVKSRQKTGEIIDTPLTILEIKGDNNAKELFEFFANPINTGVEWTHAKIGGKNSGRNVVGTSHQRSSTAVGHYLRQTGYTLREVNHNHPSGAAYPSGGDMKGASLYHDNNSSTQLNIYTHPKNYTPYNEQGVIRELPEVKIENYRKQ